MYNPKQLEIDYTWPLTEQITLDLDYMPSWEYDNEKRKKQIISSASLCSVGGAFTFLPVNREDWTTYFNPANMVVELDKSPGLIKKQLLKVLDVKWKTK